MGKSSPLSCSNNSYYLFPWVGARWRENKQNSAAFAVIKVLHYFAVVCTPMDCSIFGRAAAMDQLFWGCFPVTCFYGVLFLWRISKALIFHGNTVQTFPDCSSPDLLFIFSAHDPGFHDPEPEQQPKHWHKGRRRSWLKKASHELKFCARLWEAGVRLWQGPRALLLPSQSSVSVCPALGRA